MSDPIRNVVRHGDTTTAGGTVIAPDNNNTVFGKQVALDGDAVSCPACNSIGMIQSAPPLPEQYFQGRRYAYGGDLCICGCPTPPRLIASTTQWHANNYKSPIAKTPAAAEWLVFAGRKPEEHGLGFDRFVVLRDKQGQPLPNMPYKITLETGQEFLGVSNALGHTKKVFSNAAHTATLEAPYHGNTDHTAHAAHGSDACGC